MPIVIAIIQAIAAASAAFPEIVALCESAIGIEQTGTVTPEQETAIRAQLDAMKAQIDAA